MNGLKPDAVEQGTYVITGNFTDENSAAVIPVTLKWGLKDLSGNIVNSREDVVILSPDSTEDVVLSGDDLEINGSYFSSQRVFIFDGTYDSSLGSGLPIRESVLFNIKPIVTTAMVTKTIEEMLSLLGIYLDDVKHKILGLSEKVLMLNDAQDKTLTILNRHVLEELDVPLLAQTLDSSGAFDLSLLANPVFHKNKGIDGVRLTGGKFCSRISFHEYRKYIDLNKVFTAEKPVYYLRGNKIYVEPYEGQTIDLYYMREPVKMELYANSINNVDCELDESVKTIIIGIACENYVDRTKEAARAYDNALKAIESLNLVSAPSDSIEYDVEHFREDTEDEFPINTTQYLNT